MLGRSWVLAGFDEGADEPAFEERLRGITTDAVREVVGETGVHPWDGVWPVEGELRELVERHLPPGIELGERECFLEWRE